MVSAAETASLPAWRELAVLRLEHDAGRAAGGLGQLLLQLVRHLLGFSAGDLEVVGHGAVEGRSRAADGHQDGEPEGDDEPAVAVGELAETVEQ